MTSTENFAPVADWATDFDHADPQYNRNAHAIWAELRGTCPVAHSERYGGTWLPTTHEYVREIAYDTENFTSRGVVVEKSLPLEPAPIGGAPPITSDPPFHIEARNNERQGSCPSDRINHRSFWTARSGGV